MRAVTVRSGLRRAARLLAGCLWLAASAAAATEPAPRVELLVAAGEGPLVVLEDGQPVTGVEVEAEVDEWRVVVLFDQLLSTPGVVTSAALELARLAPELVALGPVEVVTLAEEVALGLPPSRDAARLEQALAWISVREGAAGGQVAVRERFLAGREMTELASDEYSAVSATAGRRVSELGAAVRRSVDEELELLERQRRLLLAWLADESDPRPRLLILVSGGWDEDPREFYRQVLRRVRMAEVAEGLAEPNPSPSLDRLGRTVSALGWTPLAYTPSRLVGSEAEPGERRPGEAEGDDRVETVVQDGREIERTTIGGVDPRDLLRRLGVRPLVPELTAGDRPLAALAAAAGGSQVEDSRQLRQALGGLAARRRLTYPTPAGAPREEFRRVEVRRSRGGEVASRRWVTAYTPRIVAETRARRLIEEDVEDGELSIAASYRADEGLVRVEAAAPAGLTAPLRVTLAVAEAGADIRFSHQLLDAADLEPVADGEAVGFNLPSLVADDPDALTVVLVEELERGAWGSGFVRHGEAAGIAAAAGSYVLPAPKAVHLLRPPEPMLIGQTSFDTVVAGDRVSRVDFYLDGELAASREAGPFSAQLDLGRLPRPRRVEAIAFDAAGAEVGRDELTVNEGTGSFRVRIVRPRPRQASAGTPPRVGTVEVEAEVRVPGGTELERLEFYWKETLVGTRFAPPYLQRVTVPAGEPTGFLRVVGYLEDGTSAEDVAFVNSPAGSENLRVELVELYTVVTDRRGRPIRGLEREDFRVVEDGVEQEIATFSDAGERPLTVGLAIDSSASMFVKLPEVQLAASTFLTGLTSRRDRAFVVGFGDEPFLQRDTTSDLSSVRTALSELRPAGRTSIWKGIAYSLVQLQGVPGKKALIVFSDGADEDPDFSYRLSLDFARRVGVPVYVVVSNDEIYRTRGKGLTIRGFMNRLESLTEAVGGRVFLTRVGEDLEAIYRDIDEELRSQYLLGYYARDREGEDWRPVSVEVDRAGARARTIAGYYR